MTRSSRSMAGNLLLALLSTALILVLAEIGLRLFRPVQHLKPPDPEKARHAKESLYRSSRVEGLTYEMAPDRNGIFEGMHVRTNASGLRGPAPVRMIPISSAWRCWATLSHSVSESKSRTPIQG